MCLAILGKIIDIRKPGSNQTKPENENKALVDLGGITKEVSLAFLPEAQINDWIIIHTGFGLQVVSEKEASETINLMRQIKDSQR